MVELESLKRTWRAANALVDDLKEMDEEGAIEIRTWPKARQLIECMPAKYPFKTLWRCSCRLARDLVEMDEIGAIELDEWVNALDFVNEVRIGLNNEDGSLEGF